VDTTLRDPTGAHRNVVELARAADAGKRISTECALLEWRRVAAGSRSVVAIDRYRERQLVVLKCSPRRGEVSLRQSQILTMLARGYSLKQVAVELGICLSTASRHIHEATRKLGFQTPVTVAMALRVSQVDDETGTLVIVGFAVPEGRGTRTLTPAESAVAGLVRRGMSNAAIAVIRRRSPRTIANQLARLFMKLGVHSRMELALAISPVGCTRHDGAP
jgi:DNA-binding NarL/FixJ family response regulator